ncbi:helicase C-terminal domain-containing protein [Enterococcus sp. LJL99]
MQKKKTYAIVDIETTGTDPRTDRIIQFGCVLVEDGEIVSRFVTDVNPNQAIPKNIQSLTGISNSQVQKAPYFEDVALTIYNLLADTIFVAHNIYFDYSFLNQELIRCGAPELKIPGIDTVELAQIFLPTEKSFRLSDLSESLGLIHDNPHQADSDAQVTAELLLLIEAKMRRLPLITMEKIALLSKQTGMDTGFYIKSIYEEMKETIAPLDSNLHVISGIALKKKPVVLFETPLYGENEYPKRKKTKEKIFKDKIAYRQVQSRMMNVVFDHFKNDESKNLFVEAATGIGKTFGYLFPMSYLATPENPVIISTVSIVLQNQLAYKDIPAANQICPNTLQATVVKSHRHYLDLQRFKGTLEQPLKQKQYALFQMRVLVWLLETVTGDLDELQLTSYNNIFWKDVAHRGIQFLATKDALYKEDFVVSLYKKMKQSNVLIVNHAFLVQESLRETAVLPESSYLIIDEAHHLPDICGSIFHYQMNLFALKKQVQQVKDDGQLFDQVNELFKNYESEKRLLHIYRTASEDLLEDLSDLFFEFNELMADKGQLKNEWIVTKEIFDMLSLSGIQLIRKIEILFNELIEIQQQIQQLIIKHLATFSISERITLFSLLRFFEQIKEWSIYFYWYMEDWRPKWLKEFKLNSQGVATLSLNDLEASILPETKWYDRYTRILYTGGTLKFGHNKSYLPEKMGITDYTMKSLPDPYDYEKQARIYVPKEAFNINESNNYEFAEYISSVVLKLSEQENRPILVLFTSHEVLTSVYYKLHQSLMIKGREVLAQNISGSREKIMKRFLHSGKGILLGADSFWEGVDLPGDALQIVIVTRLPFENPRRPLVKARYDYLESQGINPFNHEALPKAALRLRQALGRLIRSEEDKGAMIILDRRLFTARYGKRIIKALPKQISVKEIPLDEILNELKKFLIKK